MKCIAHLLYSHLLCYRCQALDVISPYVRLLLFTYFMFTYGLPGRRDIQAQRSSTDMPAVALESLLALGVVA